MKFKEVWRYWIFGFLFLIFVILLFLIPFLLGDKEPEVERIVNQHFVIQIDDHTNGQSYTDISEGACLLYIIKNGDDVEAVVIAGPTTTKRYVIGKGDNLVIE